MLKNLKYLNKRAFSLYSSSSLVILDKSLTHLSLKPQPQLQIEFRRMFSSANKGPENKGPDNNEFKDSGFMNLQAEEKVWKSPTPLVFKNGEMSIFKAETTFRRHAIFNFCFLGSLILFSGYKLSDFKNRTWYGALFYFLLGGASLTTSLFTALGFSQMVWEIRLLNDGKRIKVRTQKVGIKDTWKIIEINKIQKKGILKNVPGWFCLDTGDGLISLPGAQISKFNANEDVMIAVLDGYSIDTSNFEEEAAVKS